MLTSLRKASKSKIGTIVVAIVGLLIIVGFGAGGISSLDLGSFTSMSASTLAKVGSQEVTDHEMSAAMQRQLARVRDQNPEADYSSIAGDFAPLLDSLIDQRALQAFADKDGFSVSKRLIDAEIANIPGVRGLNGKVSEQSYQTFLQRQRLTDATVRDLISGTILQRLLITPAANGAKVPLGIATPYASMLLEAREGEVAVIPVSQFAAGLNPSDAQIEQFYKANTSRYMIPEQRVLKVARIGPEQVTNVQASDQEIAQYYNDHQDLYGSKEIRVISQAVVPDQKVANQIAASAKGGASFVDAVKPAGLSAADISVGPQTQKEFADLAGDKVAAAAFGAPAGAVVGPIQSPLGWHVVKIDSVKSEGGKSLAAARGEIAEKITADKRKAALSDLGDKIQDALDGGSNLDEAAKQANVAVTATPLITGSGRSLTDPSYKFPDELAQALKSGFDLQPDEEPVVEQLPDDKGFALVAPGQVVASAPAPLASIRDQVRQDWIQQEANSRARALAHQIAKAATGPTSLADAAKQANASLPPVQKVNARRLQISQLGDKVPPPMAMLFTLGQGKANVTAAPQGQGYYVVKAAKIIPGNPLDQPRLIGEVQKEFEEPMTQELAQELMTAIRKDVKVKRNEPAIISAKQRMTTGG
jgi:peptidyl-prolyl cis-trans isomerase D